MPNRFAAPIAALVTALFAFASPASAEVVQRTADSFTLRYAVGAEIDPGDIPGVMTEVGKWWDSAHTYSGDAGNITVDLRPGGCWCERLADGSAFEHARAISVEADRLVFDAPFGPLKGKTTRAMLTVTWPPANMGRTPTWTMIVEGPGIGAMADPVDGVMGAGFARFIYYLERGEAP